MEVRRGSNERDSSSSTEWSSPVMLSATDPSLRGGVTRCDCSNGQGLFFTSEPCLTYTMNRLLDRVIVTLSGTLQSIRRISKEIIKHGSAFCQYSGVLFTHFVKNIDDFDEIKKQGLLKCTLLSSGATSYRNCRQGVPVRKKPRPYKQREIARACTGWPLSATLKWRKQSGLRVLRRKKSQKSWVYLNERKNTHDNNTSAHRRSQCSRTPRTARS